MDLITGIKERRSVRVFTDEPFTKEDFEKLVETAKYAPSWKNTQTTRYTLVLNREIQERIADEANAGFVYNSMNIKAAPALVIVSTVDKVSGFEKDGTPSTTKGEHWQSFDAGIATQTFCLAAHEAGFGTVILGIFDADKAAEIAGIPENEKVSTLLPIGRPARVPNMPPRKEVSEISRVIE